MAVTAAAIKELRELTGSGMLDCKKALEETSGDVKEAIEFLRKKGLATAAKKAGRIAAEGVVSALVSGGGERAVVAEVNCETDFVAINADFKEYVTQIAKQLLDSPANTVDEFLEEKWALDPAQTVSDVLTGKIATIGEKISIRRFERFVRDANGVISSYVHGGGKIGVIMYIKTEAGDDPRVAEMGKNLCMQTAALFPRYLNLLDVPADFIAKEKEIIAAAIAEDPSNAKKPQNVIEKMADGRLNKQLKDICLLEQDYVKDGSVTVAQYVQSVAKSVSRSIEVVKFACYEKGEGIEKKREDFAAEVAKVIG
jgi:elongation factor Ts